jgi:hypothetical protein
MFVMAVEEHCGSCGKSTAGDTGAVAIGRVPEVMCWDCRTDIGTLPVSNRTAASPIVLHRPYGRRKER